MGSAKKAADDLQLALGDARKTITAATALFAKAQTGHGLLANLLNNGELARDLQALISNMRAHGVLFYRDSAAKAEARATPARSPVPAATPSRPRR